tara:strand:+ start:711 stop:1868 length:1158 start_codon:yes stop_codon:yes gene_type:complete
MPTKFDVFAEIIEKAPCKQKDLGFRVPVYIHIKSLEESSFIKKTGSGYLPIKSKKTELIFKIIKECIKRNLNYNFFLKKNLVNVISNINKSQPNIRPDKYKGNQKVLQYLGYLEENQFILKWKLRPARGTLLKHSLLENLFNLNNLNAKLKSTFLNSGKLNKLMKRMPEHQINPFEKDFFEHIAGSAQLEGSTVSIGETIEILTKEIYPDKKQVEIQMIKNLNEALIYVLNNFDEGLASEHIKVLNEKIMFSLHRGAGKFKQTQNRIQGNPHFKTTVPKLVPVEIEKFCNTFNEIENKEDALESMGRLHNDFQRIHPFPDGNSRTTRAIIIWLLIKFKLPPVVLKAGSFETYMNLTKLAVHRSDEELTRFLKHILIHENLHKMIV